MKYENRALKGFIIVGISVKTSNLDGKAQTDIGQLWAKFLQDNVALSIPNRVSDDVYCVYTDYESDFRGEYTTLIGCKVSSTEGVSTDFTVKEVPACDYQEYVSKGQIPDCVGATWMHIWQSDIDRKYIADFDIYATDTQNPEETIVTTYLSVN